jgi:hypothetical protein
MSRKLRRFQARNLLSLLQFGARLQIIYNFGPRKHAVEVAVGHHWKLIDVLPRHNLQSIPQGGIGRHGVEALQRPHH